MCLRVLGGTAMPIFGLMGSMDFRWTVSIWSITGHSQYSPSSETLPSEPRTVIGFMNLIKIIKTGSSVCSLHQSYSIGID